MSLTAKQQIEREAASRANPPLPPLDAASREIIEKAYATKGHRLASSKEVMIEALEKMAPAERAEWLMRLTMAARKSFPA